MQRWRLILEYDGSAFNGWQRQTHGFGVQQALEEAIYAFCQQRATVIAAGRTDSGVHALGQVAHVDLDEDSRIDSHTLQHGLTFHLQKSNHDALVVLSAQAVAPSFHARFSAEARHYIYRILNRPSPSPLLRGKVWHIPHPLDVEAMQSAAKLLVGLHDFSHFRAANCQAKNTRRNLDVFDITVEGALIELRVQSPAFLYKQVRIMTAAVVAVGKHKLSLQQLQARLDNPVDAPQQRKQAAPSRGLYLQKIDYSPTPSETPPEILSSSSTASKS